MDSQKSFPLQMETMGLYYHKESAGVNCFFAQ